MRCGDCLLHIIIILLLTVRKKTVVIRQPNYYYYTYAQVMAAIIGEKLSFIYVEVYFILYIATMTSVRHNNNNNNIICTFDTILAR